MAEDRMAVLEMLRKVSADGDVDFLREGVRVLAAPPWASPTRSSYAQDLVVLPPQHHYMLWCWRARRDSNPRPSDPKSASRWGSSESRFVRGRQARERTPSSIPG